MPVQNQHDASLNTLLADFAERLAASGANQIAIGCDELDSVDPECLEILCGTGLLAPFEPANSIICDGCERACPMEVEFSGSPSKASSTAFVVCNKRDDIGRVPVKLERLQQMQISFSRIARVLAPLLGTDCSPKPGASGVSWDLGIMQQDKQEIEAVLRQDGNDSMVFPGLTVSLCPIQGSTTGAAISLPTLIRFRNGQPQLNQPALKRVLKSRYDDSRIAWEIRFEGGDIILINHVTGGTKTIASPNFNSTNDNAFQVLYANPGRYFALRDLQNEARDPTIADLHKMVENLKFRGNLKKAFFRVSADSIRFERIASMGQLTTLRIDPKSVF